MSSERWWSRCCRMRAPGGRPEKHPRRWPSPCWALAAERAGSRWCCWPTDGGAVDRVEVIERARARSAYDRIDTSTDETVMPDTLVGAAQRAAEFTLVPRAAAAGNPCRSRGMEDRSPDPHRYRCPCTPGSSGRHSRRSLSSRSPGNPDTSASARCTPRPAHAGICLEAPRDQGSSSTRCSNCRCPRQQPRAPTHAGDSDHEREGADSHRRSCTTPSGGCGCRKSHPYPVTCRFSRTADDPPAGAPR
jgi:hypothetical protein